MSDRRRWAARVAIGAMALVLASANGFLLVKRNDATAVGLEESLSAYRAQAAAPATERPRTRRASEARAATSPSGSSQVRREGEARVRDAVAGPVAFTGPRAGVYTYETQGYEEISFASSRHDYPSETYATVEPRAGCGWQLIYRMIEEHVDRVDYCSLPGSQSITANHSEVEFFGKRESAGATCDPAAVMVRTGDRAGTTIRSVCRSEDGSVQRHAATFLGIDTVRIGGEPIEAFHVIDRVRLSGRADGTAQAEVWFHPLTGMPLKLHRKADTDGQASFGTVHYVEDVRMTLRSLEPAR